MNNLRVHDPMMPQARSLSRGERGVLNAAMEEAGYFTKSTLSKALKKTLELEPANLEAMLLVPEMENARRWIPRFVRCRLTNP